MSDILDIFHPVLKRQLQKFFPNGIDTHQDLITFIRAVHETYVSNDEGRGLLEHSLEVSSEELLQRNSQLRAIFEAFPDIFIRIDLSGRILDYKSANTGITKLFPEPMIARQIQELPFLRIDQKMLMQSHADDHVKTYEQSYQMPNRTVYLELRMKTLLTDQLIIIVRDITERKNAEEKLRFAALHDDLTMLPNRALLSDRLQYFIKRNRRNKDYHFAVMFVDFDRFKLVNDSLGHQVGDQLLLQVSKRLMKAVREEDTVARLGGDEFCIVLDDVKTDNDVLIAVNRIQGALSTPYFLGNKEVFLTVSIGIVMNSSIERTSEEYIRDADIAMYHAKSKGRAQHVFFNDAMRHSAVRLLDLEGDLHRAIKNNEFELHYQPIIDLDTRTVLRMEALIRWRHPEKGMILPMDFIPLAEQTGLIIKIGDFVLRQACGDCRQWQREGYPEMGVAINLSSIQFHHTNLPAVIHGALEQTGLEPRFLELEITESVAIKNIEYTIGVLNRLKEMNVMVSIDDFGTGYSSLGSLIEFPIDSLKIDRKFIQHITGHRHSSSLTSAIITLAHNLGLKVVGEGIETTDQLHFLKSNKCDEGQGYLISRPIPESQVLALLKSLKK